MPMNRLTSIVFLLAVSATVAACNSIVGFSELTRVNGTLPADSDAETTEAEDDPEGDDPAVLEDGGAEPDAGADEPDAYVPPATTTCPAAPPLSYPPFVKPTVPASKPCKPGDLSVFLENELEPYDAQKATMTSRNRACANCIYKSQSDAVWGPMTRTRDQRTFVDFGLCYAAAGASPACAEAAHEVEWCLQKVCNVCTQGLSLVDCRDSAFDIGGECELQADEVLLACEDDAQIVNVTCRSSREVVGVLCGGL